MSPLLILILLAITSAMLALLLQQNHFLMSLLCLEGIMLNTVMLIPMMMYKLNMFIPSISIVLLTFGACEASLGLSLMVKMSRSYGSDMMSSTSTNKC